MSPLEAAIAEHEERRLRQRQNALLRANEIREYRARAKEDLAAARVRFAEVMIGVDPRLKTAPIMPLLISVRGVGKVGALGWLRFCGISPTAPIERITQRQRLLLVSCVEAHERRSRVWKQGRQKIEEENA